MIAKQAEVRARGRLSDVIRKGESLQASAAMVGDGLDYGEWQRKRAHWAARAAEALGECVAPGPARAFERTARPSPSSGNWFEDLPEERGRLREAIEALQVTLARLDSG